MPDFYEIDTKNHPFGSPEEKDLEKALSNLGEIKCVKAKGQGLTYVIETVIILPPLVKEKIKKRDDVEGIRHYYLSLFELAS